jgi:hypothetical protein
MDQNSKLLKDDISYLKALRDSFCSHWFFIEALIQIDKIYKEIGVKDQFYDSESNLSYSLRILMDANRKAHKSNLQVLYKSTEIMLSTIHKPHDHTHFEKMTNAILEELLAKRREFLNLPTLMSNNQETELYKELRKMTHLLLPKLEFDQISEPNSPMFNEQKNFLMKSVLQKQTILEAKKNKKGNMSIKERMQNIEKEENKKGRRISILGNNQFPSLEVDHKQEEMKGRKSRTQEDVQKDLIELAQSRRKLSGGPNNIKALYNANSVSNN